MEQKMFAAKPRNVLRTLFATGALLISSGPANALEPAVAPRSLEVDSSCRLADAEADLTQQGLRAIVGRFGVEAAQDARNSVADEIHEVVALGPVALGIGTTFIFNKQDVSITELETAAKTALTHNGFTPISATEYPRFTDNSAIVADIVVKGCAK